jgi:sugar/nucleoside kinase (ribokinase family)
MKNDRMLDCIVAGDANVDLMIDGAPEPEFNTEKLAEGMDLVLGGSSAITVFNLARLGARTGFVGVVGRDSFGDFVAQRLSSAGVNLECLRRHTKEKTGITIWLSRKKKRAAITYSGTIALLRASDITEDYLSQARHLHIGHYFLLQQFHKGAAAVFRKAKKLGLTTSLDCNYDPTGKWDSGIREVLRYTDIFFPNEDEARYLTGADTADAAAKELATLAGTVAVKRGASGVLVRSNGVAFRKPAAKTKVVDTTGAGDSFNAGYLSRFLKGAGVEECTQAGLAAASRCVARIGGTAAFESGKP